MSSIVRLAIEEISPLVPFILVIDCFCRFRLSELLELAPEDTRLTDGVAPVLVVEFDSELDACSSSLSIF